MKTQSQYHKALAKRYNANARNLYTRHEPEGYVIGLLWIRSHWNAYREQKETSVSSAFKNHLNGWIYARDELSVRRIIYPI